jgi:uncharacterized protein YjiS (DUF1127 family)
MITRVEKLMSGAIVDRFAIEHQHPILAPAIAAGWAQLRSLLTRWSARRRLRRSVAHLNDRLLADVGLSPRDLGFCEILIRRYVAGGDTRTGY